MESFFSLCQGYENIRYKIVKIDASGKVKRRLLDLGFVDASVIILKKSNFKGVFLLQIRGYVLSLKRKEVSSIMVENYR
ncbi:MAG: ferrous iron transport protein A [Clostridia bacterium]|nr:ferrous iron transport protein A [Clostridia bacterium]